MTDPNPYSAPANDKAHQPWVELQPGQAWPPICLRCGAPAHGAPAMRLPARGHGLSLFALVGGIVSAFLVQGHVPAVAVGGLILATGLFSMWLRPRVVEALPHCDDCAARVRRAQIIRRISEPLGWVAAAAIWALPDLPIFFIALPIWVVSAILIRRVAPRRLLVFEVEPTKRIANVDPVVAARIQAALDEAQKRASDDRRAASPAA